MDQDQQLSNHSHPNEPQPSPFFTKKRVRTIILFFIGTICMAIFMLFYIHQQFDREKQTFQKQQIAFQVTLKQSLEQLQVSNETKLEALNQRLSQSLSNQQNLSADWALIKARHCLELAAINQLWGQDTASTIALLNQADQLIASLNRNDTTFVRQAIADERTALLAIEPLDINGIASTIESVLKAIEPLKPYSLSLPASSEQPKNTTTEASDQHRWKTNLQKAIAALRALVVIRNSDDAIALSMNPTYRSLQKASIRMSLMAAEAALIQRQTLLFQQAIQQAEIAIQQAFDMKNQSTISIINQLDSIKKIDLNIPKPSLDASLQQLNQLIDSNSPHLTQPLNQEQSS